MSRMEKDHNFASTVHDDSIFQAFHVIYYKG